MAAQAWTAKLDTEAMAFVGHLTHDDHSSNYIIAANVDGRWQQRAFRVDALMEARVPERSSVYMARNGFVGHKRGAECCRQVNAMMFDIDCHGDDFLELVPRLVGVLDDAYADDVLPMPTMTVSTGRGVQLYYVLQKAISYLTKDGAANGKLLAYFKDVESGLARAIEGVVSSVEGAKLDPSVYDFSRVGRLPGTYNPKARAWCTLLHHREAYFELRDLKRYGADASNASRWANTRKRAVTARKADAVLRTRLAGIERLQKHRRYACEGSRENMCFVYYNTAVQLYGRDGAYAATVALNKKFSAPLPESDIACISRTVDSNTVLFGAHAGEKGFYPLTSETVAEKLFMTREEMAAVNFFGSKRQRDREAAKAARAGRRKARDARIVHLFRMGATQAEVAHKVGCSRRTVAGVLKGAGVGRSKRYTLEEKFSLVISGKCESANSCQKSWFVWQRARRGCGGRSVGVDENPACACEAAAGLPLERFALHERGKG